MKHNVNFRVVSNTPATPDTSLLKLEPVGAPMPEGIEPGQFAQVEVPDSKSTFLRRPISICNVEDGLLWLLVRKAGEGTRHLAELAPGRELNLIMPLGHGFTLCQPGECALLAGGGVGTAPLLMLGKALKERGVKVQYALGARNESQLALIEELSCYGDVSICTDDGSAGTSGNVLASPAFGPDYDHIYCCGPLPMMKAVAAHARARGIDCEVSLENMMACGLGACLCCVEDTADSGNVCVCTEGPVFNINRLKW